MVTITINTDNAAFTGATEYELARILTQLAEDIQSGKVDEDGAELRDSNGNTCGIVQVIDD